MLRLQDQKSNIQESNSFQEHQSDEDLDIETESPLMELNSCRPVILESKFNNILYKSNLEENDMEAVLALMTLASKKIQ